ncbi:MAG: ethylbenzene dehydrogenase [Sulfurospirillum sp.]|nr:ethylbenzene dehydrogenase [Sulfurospirillum sp.]
MKVSTVLAACLIAGSSLFGAGILESFKGSPASMDSNDVAWVKGKTLTILVDQKPYQPANYKGIQDTSVDLKSLYDAENIYFRVEYADPTQSLERYPWIKQADGTWKMKKNYDETGHENTYYEDKFAMFWNINTKGFDKKGCAIACHIAKDGKINGYSEKAPGRKYTRNLKETIDMWHWMSVRGEPVGHNTDQFVDSTDNGKTNKNWGRKGDEIISGGYKDNVNKEKTAPIFMSKNKDHKEFWILESDKVPFVDTFKAGDMIPSMIVAPMEGSRGDVASKAKWENGKWTLVFKRALVTKHPKSEIQDVQFNDLKKEYSFGVAVFDNTALNHLYHDGVFKLSFK